MWKKKLIVSVLGIFALWLVVGAIDFMLVHNYHKPIFCIGIDLADDGGSGTYVGLGYSFDIEGNFLPDAKDPGVTSYRGYVFGQEVSRGFWEVQMPEETTSSYQTKIKVSYANWNAASQIYSMALNNEKMAVSSQLHLPVYHFDTFNDLSTFKETFDDSLTLDQGWDEVPSFDEITQNYDNTYFETNSLILVYVSANNSTHRYDVSNVSFDKNTIVVKVKETTKAEEVDTAMAGWFLVLEIADDLVTNETEFDAVLDDVS